MKATLRILIVSILLILPLNLIAQIEPTDTNGNGFRNVSTLEHLRWISVTPSSWNDNFELDNDIDASDTENWNDGAGWSPIGSYSTHYTGFFEGNSYKIDNLFINRPDQNHIGLFGVNSGSILNIGITNAYIIGKDRVGVIVGENAFPGTVISSFCLGQIMGRAYVGGIVGSNNGAIRSSFSNLKVSANFWVGGLVGENNNGIILNCYSHSDVSGDSRVGGLVGTNSLPSIILKSYSTGRITGNSWLGGLVGKSNGTVCNSYWDVESSGMETSADGEGKTTEEMKSLGTYIDSGWNFDFIWKINDGYPFIDVDFSFRPTDTDGNGFINISTLNDLRWLSESGYDFDKNFELDKTIDAKDTENWNCNLGWLSLFKFLGTFDGKGYEIVNLHINNPLVIYTGIFGISSGKVQNIGVSNVSIIGGSNVGGLVGLNSGQLINSYCIGVVSGTKNIGGLVGVNEGHIEYSYGKGEVLGTKNIGGLVGVNEGHIEYSFGKGDVSGTDIIGGLVGYNSSIIINCYSSSKVSGNNNIGGFVGYNIGNLSDSFSSGEVSGNNNVGGFVGLNIIGQLTSSYSTGTVLGIDNVGGFVGCNTREITNSYSTGIVSGRYNVGGLVGFNNFGAILYSYSTGNVLGVNSVGGLIGWHRGTVINNYSKSNVIGEDYVGGIVWKNNGRITNSYSTGVVSGSSNVGGLVGFHFNSLPDIASFWDVETSGMETSSGGTGKSTEEMKTKSTFTDVDWDFEVIWSIHPDINDGYPYLMMNKPTSVADEQATEQHTYNFNVYPNPFAGSINLEFDLPAEMPISIVLMDNTGKTLHRIFDGAGNVGLNNHIVELTELPSGLYFIILSTNTEILTQKVISVR